MRSYITKISIEIAQLMLLFSVLEERLSSQKDRPLETENQPVVRNEVTDMFMTFIEITRLLDEEILQNILPEERQSLSSLNSMSATVQSLIIRLQNKSE
jgi:hypothetical protein